MLIQKLKTLPVSMADFIRQAGILADELGVNVYLVGGFVRDVFLRINNFDVDLVVEGDGIFFARECSRRFGLRLVAHGRFGTATLHGPEGFKVDIASSRRESYEKPAALPVVSRGAIKDDLFRRDFTVNAMAIGINKHLFGEVLDYYGGVEDLKLKVIRALHEESFVDDPTRILRAVRFERRLKFHMERRTKAWLCRAVSSEMLFCVQKHRLRDELVLIFQERDPFSPLKRLYDLCGYDFIASGLAWRADWREARNKISRASAWYARHLSHKRRLDVYVMVMCLFFSGLTLRRIKDAMAAFAFHKSESLRILSFRSQAARIEKQLSRKVMKPSRIYRLLEPLSYEVIVLIDALTRSAIVRRRIRDFLEVYSAMRLHVRGEDLARLGLLPGPHFKKVLNALHSAKVDGKLSDRLSELACAQKLLHRLDRGRWRPDR